MPKFIVEDMQPCWVTWTYEIEAENEIDFIENTTTVRPVT